MPAKKPSRPAPWREYAVSKTVMNFVGQIDSFEHESKRNKNSRSAGDQNFMFGDVGMIYVFYCIACAKAKAIVQYG